MKIPLLFWKIIIPYNHIITSCGKLKTSKEQERREFLSLKILVLFLGLKFWMIKITPPPLKNYDIPRPNYDFQRVGSHEEGRAFLSLKIFEIFKWWKCPSLLYDILFSKNHNLVTWYHNMVIRYHNFLEDERHFIIQNFK